MTHWFDRLSRRGLSADVSMTRRDALGRFGSATLALSALGLVADPSPAVSAHRPVHHAFLSAFRSQACQHCIQEATDAYDAVIDKEFAPLLRQRNPSLDGTYVFHGGLVLAAAEIAYRTSLGVCAGTVCNVTAMQPQPSTTATDPGNIEINHGCGGDTHYCPDSDLCCFGEDICCADPETGTICCADAVGCLCVPIPTV